MKMFKMMMAREQGIKLNVITANNNDGQLLITIFMFLGKTFKIKMKC